MGRHGLSCRWWAEAIEVKKPSENCKLLRDAHTLTLLTDGTVLKPRIDGDNHHFSRFYAENRCFGEDPIRRFGIFETFNGTRPDLNNGVVRFSFMGRCRCIFICVLWDILLSRCNTVPVSETDVLVGLFCFPFGGRRSVIGGSGEPVTYWRTRVFVKNDPCSNYCNIRLDAVYAFGASLHRLECCLACLH